MGPPGYSPKEIAATSESFSSKDNEGGEEEVEETEEQEFAGEDEQDLLAGGIPGESGAEDGTDYDTETGG